MSYHHGDLANTIINTALEAIEAEGIANISIRSLALKAGVSAPALYHHFKNRSELLVKVAAAGCVRLYDILMEAQNTGESPDQRMKAIGIAMILFAYRNPNLYSLIYNTKEIESAFLEGDDFTPLQQVYAIISDISQQRIEHNGFSVNHHALTIATWTAIDGFSRMLIDKRNGEVIFRLTGSRDPITEEKVQKIADQVTEVYIGRL